MSWLLYKRLQEEALLKEKPVIEMTADEYQAIRKYIDERVLFFSEVGNELRKKGVFMGKEVRVRD